MLLTAIASAALAMSAPPPAHHITYITREMYAPQQSEQNYELGSTPQPQVVGTIPATPVANDPHSMREELGGQEAPEWIIIRHRDGLFAIDPFVPLPKATPEAARQLFKAMEYGTSGPVVTLDTDRSQYGRRRIVRTEELFRVLEHQRILWLKSEGYYGGITRVIGNPNAAPNQTSAEPREDMPRTRRIESVRANPSRPLILSGDAPVRISMPDLGVSKEVRDRVAAHGGVLNAPASETEVARSDRSEDESVNQ